MNKNNTKKITISWFFIAIIVFAIIKQILVANLPIVANTAEKFDDGWMMKLAYNIANGNWLGEFDSNTLMKELFAPIYLGICSKLGLSFIGTTTLLYTIGCIVFVYAIEELFKSKWSLFLIYLVLLFNPVSYMSWTLQRVYRCGLTLIEVLVLFGCFFALYIKRRKRTTSLIPWSITAGLSLAATYHTREDRIWILPFVAVVTIVLIINTIVSSKKKDEKIKIKNINYKRLIVVILPIIILQLSNNILSYYNNKYYGLYTYNIIDDSNFSRAVSCFYKVKTEDDSIMPRISVPVSKLDVLYEISPTLSSIKDTLSAQWGAWGYAHEGQNENGMIIWPLISAVEECGYYESAKKADDFYKAVADEIEEAIANKKVESRAAMPSPLMPPWRKEYCTQLPKTMFGLTVDTIKFINMSAECNQGKNDQEENVRFAEAITNDLAIKNESDQAILEKQKLVNRVNKIVPIYSCLFPIIAILGVISYILITIRVIINLKKKDTNNVDTWLILTALLLSYVVLIGGVSYNDIASVNSTYYMYRSGGYPLIITFAMTSSMYVIENIFMQKKYKNKEEKFDEENV